MPVHQRERKTRREKKVRLKLYLQQKRRKRFPTRMDVPKICLFDVLLICFYLTGHAFAMDDGFMHVWTLEFKLAVFLKPMNADFL
jgi:hypothetical protein